MHEILQSIIVQALLLLGFSNVLFLNFIRLFGGYIHNYSIPEVISYLSYLLLLCKLILRQNLGRAAF